MALLKGYEISKVWFQFSKSINGKIVRFRWEQLPKHRLEEFIDFKMNYFVKHEKPYVIAGVPESPDAMAEYREILLNQYRNDPSVFPSICCVDGETNQMIATDALLLYRKGETNKGAVPAQTAELKNYYKIMQEVQKLCPIGDVMKKYKVDQIFEDEGFAIHPDYKNYRINSSGYLLRQVVCMANEVPLTGAWLTDIPTQLATTREGWDTVYEISREELEKVLGMKLETAPPTIVYKVKTVG